jgi:hypothetical protein
MSEHEKDYVREIDEAIARLGRVRDRLERGERDEKTLEVARAATVPALSVTRLVAAWE